MCNGQGIYFSLSHLKYINKKTPAQEQRGQKTERQGGQETSAVRNTRKFTKLPAQTQDPVLHVHVQN